MNEGEDLRVAVMLHEQTQMQRTDVLFFWILLTQHLYINILSYLILSSEKTKVFPDIAVKLLCLIFVAAYQGHGVTNFSFRPSSP